ncbi:GPW/gp25 family protein [Xanthobacter sp. TB0136]|uniref:GPW/gp25 family protein n=1 Tax=Xanthobacter sp. TB0136 TaxID=3459177 RepID=UPI0040396F25
MSAVGIDRRTGKILRGWDHVQQSITVILTTMVGERVMRRDFGSEVPALVDRPMTTRVILAVYAATANALRRWEPRFRLTKCEIVQASVDGTLHLMMGGDYMPRGHLGDSTVDSRREFTVALAA